MTRDEKKLDSRARSLARKFYEDVQALFDDADMTDDLYNTEVMQCVLGAQGYAEDAINAERGS